jgi:dUTPase
VISFFPSLFSTLIAIAFPVCNFSVLLFLFCRQSSFSLSPERRNNYLTPPKTDGRIAPRSGLASKHFIDTGAGVIDADYRGQVKVLLFNHAETDFEIKEGDRIAQLVLERIYTPDVVEVQELEASVRGAGGFGSTG